MKRNSIRKDHDVEAFICDAEVTVITVDGHTYYHIVSEEIDEGVPILCTSIKRHNIVPSKPWLKKVNYTGDAWILQYNKTSCRLYQEEVEDMFDDAE